MAYDPDMGGDLNFPVLARRAGTIPARATVDAISGDVAYCFVEVAGTILPAELPADVLAARGVGVGMRFLWWMASDGSVDPADIDDLPREGLTHRELEELQRLQGRSSAGL